MADPAPPAPRRDETAPDSYEEKYMGAGRSLARTRKAMPWWFFALMAAVATTTVVASVASGKILPVLIALGVLGLTTLLLSHVRCVVTATTVHIQFGLFGPKIAVERITRCAAEAYAPVKYGGWGIRLGIDGSWAFSVPGGNGQGVRIEYVDPKGRPRAVFVSTNEPAEVIAAIEKARASAAGTGVRVADAEATAPAASPDSQESHESHESGTRGASSRTRGKGRT